MIAQAGSEGRAIPTQATTSRDTRNEPLLANVDAATRSRIQAEGAQDAAQRLRVQAGGLARSQPERAETLFRQAMQ